MRDLFPGWVPPDEATLDRYWSEATFAIDTSVLLDLYRFSEEAREGLLKALRSFDDRLWIPHQVGLEFHRNRLGVLLDQREAEENLLRELDQIRQDLDRQLSQLLRGAGRRDLAPLREAIDGGFDRLEEKLREAEKEHTKGLGGSVRDDPIYDEVVALCANRVGPPFDEERESAVIKDGEERFQTKTPPGYLDEGKDEKTKYGDVILWHQLCDRALETKKPVVLIADDQKADWVWEVRGKTIGPRPELVAEMNERAGVGFHLYTPTRLLEIWEKREEGQGVGPAVLAEIEDSTASKERDPIKAQLLYDIAAQLYSRAEGHKTSFPTSYAKGSWHVHHLMGSDHVELLLEHQGAAAELPVSVGVTVQTPDAGFKTASASPVTSTLNSVVYLVRYPDDFDSGPLAPGEHRVIWGGMFQSQGSGLPEGFETLATDSFRTGG